MYGILDRYVGKNIVFSVVLVSVCLTLFAGLINLIDSLRYIGRGDIDFGFVLVCINYIPVVIITFLFGKFVIYHIKLVLTNSSTIESLDQENKDKYKRFCLTPKENFEQVFGKNKLFWLLPVINEQSKPVGDGLLWKVNNEAVNLNDINPQK